MAGASAPTSKRDRDTTNNGHSSGPRRSGLVQERSRRTRQQLVNAAVKLWTERGFDEGIDETTVEEIVQAAGVTKGTFYFHFAHKEDILLEVGWGTSEALFKDATKLLGTDRTVDEILDELLGLLARRISNTRCAAVARTLAEFYRRPDRGRESRVRTSASSVPLPSCSSTRRRPASSRRPPTRENWARCSRRWRWALSTHGSASARPTSRPRCACSLPAARRSACGRRVASDHMIRL